MYGFLQPKRTTAQGLCSPPMYFISPGTMIPGGLFYLKVYEAGGKSAGPLWHTESHQNLGCDLLQCYPRVASQMVCECGAACKDREQNHARSREYWVGSE